MTSFAGKVVTNIRSVLITWKSKIYSKAIISRSKDQRKINVDSSNECLWLQNQFSWPFLGCSKDISPFSLTSVICSLFNVCNHFVYTDKCNAIFFMLRFVIRVWFRYNFTISSLPELLFLTLSEQSIIAMYSPGWRTVWFLSLKT